MTSRTQYRADVLRYNGVGAALRAIVSDVEHGTDRITRHQAPAAQAAASTTPKENRMSLLTEVENGWNAVDAEYIKLKAAFPGALEKAKAFEASPFMALAEKAAASILPPEAVAIAVKGAEAAIDELIKLYTPAETVPAGQ